MGIIDKLGINGFPGYQVLSCGIILSDRKKQQAELKRPLNRKGYEMVMLYGKSKRKFYAVHRIVAEHFIPNPEGMAQVNHIDGNKLNNNVNNLEWVSASANIKHAYDYGLTPVGEGHHQSKLKNKDIYEIRGLLEKGSSQREIAKLYGVSQHSIYNIKRGKTWAHI